MNRLNLVLGLLIFVIVLNSQVGALNILVILPFEGKSHFFVFQTYLRELARRNHNLTVISHFPQKIPLKNYHDISLTGKSDIIENVMSIEKHSYRKVLSMTNFLFDKGVENCKLLLENKEVQNLWKNKPKFDVIVYEMFNSDCGLGLAYQFQAPVVGITSCGLIPTQYKRFGIPDNPSYVPFIFLDGGFQPTLYQRIETIILGFYFNLYYMYTQHKNQVTLSKYFDNVPPLDELARDIRYALVYHNFPLTGSRLFPANVIEVGGYHVAQPNPLSGDLLKFIEESEHGIIYISLGSMLKANSFPSDKRDAILAAVSKIPQRVVWKWDNQSLPGNPKNIYTSNWLPQNDILAHPKAVAFLSHAGLLGTTEAIHHGVPMIAMPVFGDQPSNAAAIEDCGLGIKLHLHDLTEKNLLEYIKKVTDKEFRANVKRLSNVWRDRPLSAMDTAIYWTEFAARHNYTFRTKAADVPLYQYLCLDILAVFTFVIIIFLVLLKLIWVGLKTFFNVENHRKNIQKKLK